MSARRLLAIALGAVLVLGACGGGDDSDDGASETTAAAEGSTDTSAGTETTEGAGECATDAPAATERPEVAAPTEELDPAQTHTVLLTTSCGDLTITLDAEQAPVGASNFAHLADAGFYDGLTFHRVVPGFVVQGGDPTGSGAGDAGYSVVTEPPPDGEYRTGDVAWAKTQADPAGTASSQFFIVLDDGTGLPADYGYAGRVTAGMETAAAMAALSPGGDGPPTQPIYIERAVLTSS